MQPRRFARVRPTGRISSEAKLIVGPKAPLVDCNIVDHATGGACLENVRADSGFLIDLNCLLAAQGSAVWKAGRRPGVSF